MIANKDEALKGIENGTISLADIEMELRSDEDIAIAAIKQYGESAITFLEATNSLPHTPEFFKKLMEEFQFNSDKIRMDLFAKTGLRQFAPELIGEFLDEEQEYYEDIEGEPENIEFDDELEQLYAEYNKNLDTLAKLDALLLKAQAVKENNIQKEGGKTR